MPAHCDVPGNERADALAKEASALPQDDVVVDVSTVHRAAVRAVRARSISQWPDGWYRTLMGARLPPPVTGVERSTAVDVHQLRAGHWSGSTAYLHRIGRAPSPRCAQCSDLSCPASWCRLCGEGSPDTPAHILLQCEALTNTRFSQLHTSSPRPEDVREHDVVAALAAAAQRLHRRLDMVGLHPPDGGAHR